MDCRNKEEEIFWLATIRTTTVNYIDDRLLTSQWLLKTNQVFFFAEILSLDQNFPFNLFSTKCFAETNAKLLTSIMDVPSCFIYILLIKNSRSFIYLACGIKILIFQSEQNHYFICDPITSKMPVFAGELM